MLRCAVRVQERTKEYEKAIQKYQEWYDEYAWRVDRSYFSYTWD